MLTRLHSVPINKHPHIHAYTTPHLAFAEDYNTSLNWNLIAQFFDDPKFQIPSLPSLQVLLKLYRSGSSFPAIPNNVLFADWRNESNQIMLLNTLVDAPPEIYTFQSTPEEIADSQMGRKSGNRAWSCVDAVRRLLILSDQQRHYPMVQKIFGKGIRDCPEVVMLSLVRVQVSLPHKH